MSLTISKPVFKSMVLGTGILATKMLLTNLYSAFPRIFARVGPPEDSAIAKWLLGSSYSTLTHSGPSSSSSSPSKDSNDHPHAHHNTQVQEAYLRAQRVIMNDLENIPISLICFWMAALANPKAGDRIGQWFGFFVAARCAHSALYLGGGKSSSPFRMASYWVGFVSAFRAIAWGVQGVLE